MPSFSSRFAARASDIRDPQPLLTYLSRRFTYHSADEWTVLLDKQTITVNDCPATVHSLVNPGDMLCYSVDNYTEPEVPTDYRVLFEEGGLVMVHKPAGLPVTRTGDVFFNTLVNQLRRDLENSRLSPLHRLDRETSGIVIFARDKEKLKEYSLIRKEVRHIKLYGAIVKGSLQPRRGFISTPLGTLPESDIRCQMYPLLNGQKALTGYQVIDETGGIQLVAISPLTGRRHQIRAHLAFRGSPVLGDKMYSHGGAFYLKRLTDELQEQDYQILGARHHLLHHCWALIQSGSKAPLQVGDWEFPKAFSHYFPAGKMKNWFYSDRGQAFIQHLNTTSYECG